MKVEDAQFVDGILTVFLYKEVPDADRPKTIEINTKAQKACKSGVDVRPHREHFTQI